VLLFPISNDGLIRLNEFVLQFSIYSCNYFVIILCSVLLIDFERGLKSFTSRKKMEGNEGMWWMWKKEVDNIEREA
jgi:uncharacterized protein YutD